LTTFGIGKIPDYQVILIPAIPAILSAVAVASANALTLFPISELNCTKPSGSKLPLEKDQSSLNRMPASKELLSGPSRLKNFFLAACQQ
jgi:hypothetical protein